LRQFAPRRRRCRADPGAHDWGAGLSAGRPSRRRRYGGYERCLANGRGADEVLIVDACTSGSTPGDIFELPGDDVEVPPPAGMNLHAFRWDSAIAFARWLLKDRYPKEVTVILIGALGLDHGAPLSEPV
jgi:hydrogenase maturation protease